MAKNNGECLVRCRYCGHVNTAEMKGLFHKEWKISKCEKCYKKIDLQGIQTMVCPHCGKLIEKTDDNICPNPECGKVVYLEGDSFQVECPECGVINLIPFNHEGIAYCAACNAKLPDVKDKREAQKPRTVKSAAQNIRLKDQRAMEDGKYIIWKLEMHEFPAKSRLQVSEGTWALLLQNGVCQYPLGPGSYLLEETGLDKSEKLDAAALGEEVILNTDIYCVRKNLPEIGWGTGANPIILKGNIKSSDSNAVTVDGRDGIRRFQLKSNGSLKWQVVDAKAFAEKYGFRQFEEKDLLDLEAGPAVLVQDTRKVIADALRIAAGNLVGMENLDPRKLIYKQADLEKQLKTELDRRMDAAGLAVGSLRIDVLEVAEIQDSKEAEEAKRKEWILGAAAKSYEWEQKAVKLYPTEDRRQYASYTFGGTVRMRVVDKDRFFAVPEIAEKIGTETKLDDIGTVTGSEFKIRELTPENIRNYFEGKVVSKEIGACISAAAQELMETKKIPVQKMYMYTWELGDVLRNRLNIRLSILGLEAEQVNLDYPKDYFESEELKAAVRQEALRFRREDRKREIIRYAEQKLDWKVDELSVNMKDRKALQAKVSFQGNARLKVVDEDRFLAQSFIAGFLGKEPSGNDEAAIREHYQQMIQEHFYAKLAGLTQSMIDSRDWDVRALERYGEQLKDLAVQTMSNLMSDRGLKVESAYMGPPITKFSPELQAYIDQEAYEERILRDEERLRRESEHSVYEKKVDAEQKMAVDDIETSVYGHTNENRENRMQSDEKLKDAIADAQTGDIGRKTKVENAQQEADLRKIGQQADKAIAGIHGEARVEEAQDRRKSAQGDRAFEEKHKEKQREYQLDREDQEAEIAKKDRYLEADVALKVREEEARQRMERAEEEHRKTLANIRNAARLNEAEFRETLTGIMHRIDESDLDWRKKLEEYERLSRNLGVRDAQDARRVTAETDRDIEAMRTETEQNKAMMRAEVNKDVGMKQIELNTAQANLKETIDRYAEDREERKAAADFARRERDKILGFEQTMEERKQTAEEELRKLQTEYAEEQRKREHEEQMERMRNEIEKLKLELETERHRITNETELGKTRSNDEAEAKKAEYAYMKEAQLAEKQAAEDRAAQQAKRDDDMTAKADSLLRYVLNLQDGITNAKLQLQAHLDDNETQVRKEYAGVEKTRAEGLNEKTREDILRRMDSIEKELIRGNAEASGREEKKESVTKEDTNEILKKIRKVMDALDHQQEEIQRLKKEIDTSLEKASARHCWRCGSYVPKGAKYCAECGASVWYGDMYANMAQTGISCPVCGHKNTPGSIRCSSCNADLVPKQ